MRAVCISRHVFLGEHICSIMRSAGIDCQSVIGLREGMDVSRAARPDVVICDYDLLATAPRHEWQLASGRAESPIVAVSLTRRPEEAHLVDGRTIAGFLYLPSVDSADVERTVLDATVRSARQRLRDMEIPLRVVRDD
ncbi:MAG: hypothetical protein ACRENC_13530 [Gemmatimonadaceae bacterium]